MDVSGKTARPAVRPRVVGEALVRDLDAPLFAERFREILDLEETGYEPTRRHTAEYLAYVLSRPGRLCFAAFHGERLTGFSLAAPLEFFPMKRGAQDDPGWGRRDTLFSADLVVAEGWRNSGVARALKHRQVEAARAAGYRRIAGRNRVGVADAMWRVNLSLGAYVVHHLRDEYVDDVGPADCLYYHIDLVEEAGATGGA